MATIIDSKITVEFEDVDNERVEIDLSEDGKTIYIEHNGSDPLCVPRAELEQFVSILREWDAAHPRRP